MDVKEERKSIEAIVGSSLVEGMAGAAAVVLSIIGLASLLPHVMASLAMLAIGFGLLIQGAGVGARFHNLLTETSEGRLGTVELGGGMSAEFIGGVGGIVLGILSLLQIVPAVLVPIGAIVFGGALLFGAGVSARLNNLEVARATDKEEARHVAREAVAASTGVQVLIGLGAAALGILALVGIVPLILSLVAFLAVGTSNLTSGTALSSRLLTVFHHTYHTV
jgi:hypothetical protein